MGKGNITRMIQYRGTGGRSARDWVQVVLVTGWPKEETWDGEVGTDINCINVVHYISLYMNGVAESCSRLCG